MVTVTCEADIDIEDYLGDVDSATLAEELMRRDDGADCAIDEFSTGYLLSALGHRNMTGYGKIIISSAAIRWIERISEHYKENSIQELKDLHYQITERDIL